MPEDQPKSQPRPATPDPAVYGGQWGDSGKQNPADKGQPDRPAKIEVPHEGEGQGEDESAVDTQSES